MKLIILMRYNNTSSYSGFPDKDQLLKELEKSGKRPMGLAVKFIQDNISDQTIREHKFNGNPKKTEGVIFYEGTGIDACDVPAFLQKFAELQKKYR
ncbi:MAG: hypothetical protein FWC61_02115 [Proteobacteria bacterium]|nr:hypothetical protein [Pseudomonadota bacterium]